MRNTHTENIQEHSLQVAMIAHSLAVISNTCFGNNINAERVAVLAIYHDSNETITGDMPTPIKYYNPDIEKAYKELEETSKEKLLSMLPPNLVPEYRNLLFYDESSYEGLLVKAANRIVIC